jgi:ferritin
MLTDTMQKALNEQINEEAYSSYLYLAMAAYFEELNLRGFAHWMRQQSGEETIHQMKFYDFIIERRGRVALAGLQTPPKDWKSPLDAFEASLQHEQHITACINSLMDLALKENDHATNSFLKWFVDEQVEEESNVDAVIQDLRRVEGNPSGLFLLDRELSQRVAATAGA